MSVSGPGAEATSARAPRGRVLVGGVGYRWLRDGSFGLAVSDALAREAWPAEVTVSDLGYGALYVTLDIGDAQPAYKRVVLVAGVVRDREPGRLYCRRWTPQPLDDQSVQTCVYEAGAGVIDIDLLLVIAQYFRALPPEVLLVELEPVEYTGGDQLSAVATHQLPAALALVRACALGDVPAELLDDAGLSADAVATLAGAPL